MRGLSWHRRRSRELAEATHDMELFSAALGVAGGAAAAQAVAQLREHRTEPTGLADLLGWGFFVGDGVVLQKDGSLLAGFAYSGPDVSAATAAELDALTQHVNDALLPFADDWMLHIDAIRRPAVAYPPGVFPDAVSRLIDDERRAAYRLTERGQFETSYALVITHLAAGRAVFAARDLVCTRWQPSRCRLGWSARGV